MLYSVTGVRWTFRPPAASKPGGSTKPHLAAVPKPLTLPPLSALMKVIKHRQFVLEVMTTAFNFRLISPPSCNRSHHECFRVSALSGLTFERSERPRKKWSHYAVHSVNKLRGPTAIHKGNPSPLLQGYKNLRNGPTPRRAGEKSAHRYESRHCSPCVQESASGCLKHRALRLEVLKFYNDYENLCVSAAAALVAITNWPSLKSARLIASERLIELASPSEQRRWPRRGGSREVFRFNFSNRVFDGVCIVRNWRVRPARKRRLRFKTSFIPTWRLVSRSLSEIAKL